MAAGPVLHALPRDGRQLVDHGSSLGVLCEELGVGIGDGCEHVAQVAHMQVIETPVADVRFEVDSDMDLVGADLLVGGPERGTAGVAGAVHARGTGDHRVVVVGPAPLGCPES